MSWLDNLGITASKGVKRFLGKAMEVLGAFGIAVPAAGIDLPIPTSGAALKVFALGVLLKYIGEMHAKASEKVIK